MIKAQTSPSEKNNEQSTTYQEMLDYYQILDQKYDQMQILDMGKTDIWKELNLIILSKDKLFDPVQIRKQNKGVLLINNGIHPGEPEGIDASMMLVRDLLEKNLIPKDLVICIIPVYNIDGILNRGLSRVNQNGPEAYGFRGNYQNLNLIRDFIMDDYLVFLNQSKNRYIVEVLEPQGSDSFFSWNFFDSVLGQKEQFSNYVFEDEAPRMLKEDAGLAAGFQEEKQKNPEINDNPTAQLDWIYKRSVHYEQSHTRYPVGRMILPAKPELK